jgi:predicted nucleic acid-binding protein
MTAWLVDKSALARLAGSPDAAEWAGRIERGLVRITTVTRLETGYSARSGSDLRAGLQRPPLSSMPVEYLAPAIEDRAVEVLTLLAGRGQHRAPSIPDLIITATAELAGAMLSQHPAGRGPGHPRGAAQVIIAEVGLDMTRFPTAAISPLGRPRGRKSRHRLGQGRR